MVRDEGGGGKRDVEREGEDLYKYRERER